MKKIKNLFLAFVLMFSAVLLIGCGGGPLDSEATVDKSGSYNKVEATSVQTEVATSKEINESTTTGYKFSTTMKSNSGTTKNVSIIKFQDGRITEAASKITIDYTLGKASTKSNIEAYLKDDCWYISAKVTGAGTNIDFKYKFTAEQEEDCEEYLESFYTALDSLSVSEILKSNSETVGTYTNGSFTYSKATVGDISKYKLVLDTPTTSTVFGSEYLLEKFESYILLKDGCLNGFEATTKSKAVIAGVETTTETHMGLTEYNGSISYPRFDNFTEASF